MDINTPPPNPPAFPSGYTEIKEGLSMRDYFAAKALQSIIMASGVKTTESGMTIVDIIAEEVAAKSAYIFADAMLAERAKEKK